MTFDEETLALKPLYTWWKRVMWAFHWVTIGLLIWLEWSPLRWFVTLGLGLVVGYIVLMEAMVFVVLRQLREEDGPLWKLWYKRAGLVTKFRVEGVFYLAAPVIPFLVWRDKRKGLS